MTAIYTINFVLGEWEWLEQIIFIFHLGIGGVKKRNEYSLLYHPLIVGRRAFLSECCRRRSGEMVCVCEREVFCVLEMWSGKKGLTDMGKKA